MSALYEGLKRIYALLKVDGDFSVVEHLYVDRVDFCSFGNSTPFRIRIVNAYNDNQDYYYIKKADARASMDWNSSTCFRQPAEFYHEWKHAG